MKYTVCSKEKDAMNLMWNVFASFGYKDALEESGDSVKCASNRIAIDKGLNSTIMILDCINYKAQAEIVSVAIEAGLAVGYNGFSVVVSCSRKVADLLYLYSLDEFCKISLGQFEFKGYSDKELLFYGKSETNNLYCDFDLSACAKSANLDESVIPETIIFAEENAEGIAYEIGYTMRLSGCLVTNFLEDTDIAECELYAKEHKISDIIRVYPDGKIQIKDLDKNTVTQTDYKELLKYYDDDSEHEHEHDCSCGCEHHK